MAVPLPALPGVRRELTRLGREEARAVGARRAGRAHLALLALAVLLAALAALGLPVPGGEALRGRLLPSLLAAAGLALLGPLLRALAAPLCRPRPSQLAARLDDRLGWKDGASTALEVEARAAPGRVEQALLLQSTQRLGALAGPPGPPSARRGRRGRAALLALFLLALLLPGVRGTAGERGAGRGGDLGTGLRERGEALDADRWLREHLHLLLAADLGAPAGAGALVGHLRTDAPLPAPLAASLSLVWDDVPRAPLGALAGASGARLAEQQPVDLRALPGLAPHLTPGRHRARLRLVPEAPPFTQAQESPEIVVEIPPSPGGGGTPPPTPPGPAPATPPPPASAPPEEGPAPEAPPTEPPPRREEAVTPLVNEGATVSKERALVAVRTPDGGTAPPPPVPLAEALRDLDRVLERAVGGESVPPAQRAYLQRYFRTLERLVGGAGR